MPKKGRRGVRSVELALDYCERGIWSRGIAARACGLPVETFIERLAATGLSVARYSVAEVLAEAEALKETQCPTKTG